MADALRVLDEVKAKDSAAQAASSTPETATAPHSMPEPAAPAHLTRTEQHRQKCGTLGTTSLDMLKTSLGPSSESKQQVQEFTHSLKESIPAPVQDALKATQGPAGAISVLLSEDSGTQTLKACFLDQAKTRTDEFVQDLGKGNVGGAVQDLVKALPAGAARVAGCLVGEAVKDYIPDELPEPAIGKCASALDGLDATAGETVTDGVVTAFSLAPGVIEVRDTLSSSTIRIAEGFAEAVSRRSEAGIETEDETQVIPDDASASSQLLPEG